ncbi:MAG: pentapeptide repeat-containing protein [Luteolibacter sp.]|uniref:pentapeptide repeat-containing protein n=1 Tax=Luteolibacter sp. TaxID=1962973 RepID=UPI003265B0D6
MSDTARKRAIWLVGLTVVSTVLLGISLAVAPSDKKSEWLSERLSDLAISGISLVLGYYVVSIAFQRHEQNALQKKQLLAQLEEFFNQNPFLMNSQGVSTNSREQVFSNIKFSYGCDFRSIDITDVNQKGLRNDFRILNLSRLDLRKCRLSHAQFSGLSIDSTTKLQGCFLPDASFENSVLDGVDFSNARLARANFRGATIKGVSFRGAVLYNADLCGAKIFLKDLDITDAQFGRRAGEAVGADFRCHFDDTTEFWFPDSTRAETFVTKLDFGSHIRRLISLHNNPNRRG